MVASLLKIGMRSLDRIVVPTVAGPQDAQAGRLHPLVAYPRLHSLLAEAERSGSLAAERRRLLNRRYSA